MAGTVNLLDDGATIPFISRYRKEATGNLDELSIQSIDQRLRYYRELEKRRATILKTIEAQEKLTPELADRINNCWDANTLEDIYLPYKPKRKTRAEAARQLGLEPLAKIIMAQRGGNIEERARQFVDGDKVPDTDAAITGAQDIIAEWVSENEAVRNAVRRGFKYDARLVSHFVKGKEIEGRNYENYYEYSMPLKRVSSHQLLAIRRGEKEGFLKVGIEINDDRTLDNIARIVVKGNGEASQLVDEAAEDSFKRLVKPSIETEFAAAAKEKADDEAIETFCSRRRWAANACWLWIRVSARVARWCAWMSRATCCTTTSSTPPHRTTISQGQPKRYNLSPRLTRSTPSPWATARQAARPSAS